MDFSTPPRMPLAACNTLGYWGYIEVLVVCLAMSQFGNEPVSGYPVPGVQLPGLPRLGNASGL